MQKVGNPRKLRSHYTTSPPKIHALRPKCPLCPRAYNNYNSLLPVKFALLFPFSALRSASHWHTSQFLFANARDRVLLTALGSKLRWRPTQWGMQRLSPSYWILGKKVPAATALPHCIGCCYNVAATPKNYRTWRNVFAEVHFRVVRTVHIYFSSHKKMSNKQQNHCQILFVPCAKYRCSRPYIEMCIYKPLTNNAVLRKYNKKSKMNNYLKSESE